MAYKIIITELAEMDLDSIVAYITQALGNRIAAANLLNAVDYCYARLEEMPNMYETCTDAICVPEAIERPASITMLWYTVLMMSAEPLLSCASSILDRTMSI